MIENGIGENILSDAQTTGRRLPDAVEQADKVLRKNYLYPMYTWAACCLVLLALTAGAKLWNICPLVFFLGVFFLIRGRTIYNVHKASNQQTLNVEYHPDLSATYAHSLIDKLSTRFKIKVPKLLYKGSSFAAAYDPNTEEITMGTYLGYYENENSCTVALHEFVHHLMLNMDNTKDKWYLLLRLAGIAQIIMVVAAICYPVFLFIVPDAYSASWSFTFFFIGIIAQKGILTAHEMEVNDYAKSILEAGYEELNVIGNRGEAFHNLKLGERTYIVDFAGWAIIAVMVLVLL